jgi:hypothetical protein
VVCEEWRSFTNFHRDMGDAPLGHSIERLDNDGPYCKDNCIWATRKEQNNNTRRTRKVTQNGKTLSLAGWADFLGVSRGVLINRLERGVALEWLITELGK